MKKFLRVSFGLPTENRLSEYKSRMKILFILEIYLLTALKVLGSLYETSLIYDQINIIAFILLTILVLICYGIYEKPKEITSFLVVGVIAIAFLTQTLILNIDRSRSFYVLSWVERGTVAILDGNIDLQKVESVEKYSKESIYARIEEQKSRGLIREEKNKYELTVAGSFLLKISNYIKPVKVTTNNIFWFKKDKSVGERKL
jgi:hypothetical protein